MNRLRFLLISHLLILAVAGCGIGIETPIPVSTPVLPTPAVLPSATSTLPVSPTPRSTPLPTTSLATMTPAIIPPTLVVSPSAPPTPTPCAEPGRMESGQLNSAVAGEMMKYRVYLPPCYDQDGYVYPVLYMFGGNVHDDAIWDTLGLDEVAGAAIHRGDIPPLLIVMPDNGWLANTTTSGPASYEGFIIDEIIPHIDSTYCTWRDANGRAVGGLSRGGYWSLMMAFRQPHMFRSAGAHSPALIDSHAGPAEDPVVTGVTHDLGGLRILIDIGERDPYLVEALPLHEALAAAGVPHEWLVNPGTHEEAYWRSNLESYLLWYSNGWRVDRDKLPTCGIPQ